MTDKKPDVFFPAPVDQPFCSNCGSKTTRMCIEGDNRERDVCLHCGAVHYRNPLVVVGALPVWEGKILMCKRAIEPRYGKWTLPAGFMEREETSAEGAARETMEEAGAVIQIQHLYTVIDIPRISQMHMYYLAQCTRPDLDPGPESLEAGFFDIEDIPWSELAFESVRSTLEHYLEDLKLNQFSTHHYTINGARPI